MGGRQSVARGVNKLRVCEPEGMGPAFGQATVTFMTSWPVAPLGNVEVGPVSSTRPLPSIARTRMRYLPGLGFTQTYLQKVQTIGEGLLKRVVGFQDSPSSKLISTERMPSRLPIA